MQHASEAHAPVLPGLDPAADAVVLLGHYGTGKTTLAVALATRAAERRPTTLADLDVVNPYFRSSDYLAPSTGLAATHERGGSEDGDADAEPGREAKGDLIVVAPSFAGTTVEAPSIPAALVAAFADRERLLVVDAGGDDVGATALGRFHRDLDARRAEFVYVFNASRELGCDVGLVAESVHEVSRAARHAVHHLVNCTHLGPETDAQLVAGSHLRAQLLADDLGLFFAGTAVAAELFDEVAAILGDEARGMLVEVDPGRASAWRGW